MKNKKISTTQAAIMLGKKGGVVTAKKFPSTHFAALQQKSVESRKRNKLTKSK